MRVSGLRLLYIGLLFVAGKGIAATQLEIGETISTNVARGGARVFTFSGYKDQLITVRAAVRPTRTGPRLRFQLFSPDEAELLATVAGRPTIELNQFWLTHDGPHTLILFDESGTFFDQDLAWVTVVDNQRPDAILESRETVSSSLQLSDIDVYNFEARAGETAVLHIEGLNDGVEPNATLISPIGNMIAKLESTGGAIESTPVALPLTGSYSMLVREGSGIVEGAYTATLNLLVPDDQDADGLGDRWELEVFGSLAMNGADDSDLDGVTNRAEFVRGTDPLVQDGVRTQPSPLLTIGVGTIDVEFTASEGGRYQLEGSSNFVDWIPLGRAVNGSNQSVRTSIAVGDNGVQFFRLTHPD